MLQEIYFLNYEAKRPNLGSDYLKKKILLTLIYQTMQNCCQTPSEPPLCAWNITRWHVKC